MRSARQSGLSMIELMIALVLGLLIISAVLQIFLAGKRSYELQADLSRVQENGRFAMEFIKRDVRGSDFWGCLTGRINDIQNNLDATVDPTQFSFGFGVSGAEGSASAGYPSNTTPPLYADTIVLKGGTGDGFKVVPPFMPSPSATLKVEDATGIEKGEILLVSDCKGGDIFQVTNDPGTGANPFDELNHTTGNIQVNGQNKPPGNANSGFSKKYQGDARVLRASTTTYEIKAGPGGEPSLYRNGTDELVEGVESMQLRYGEDLNGDGSPEEYRTADAVTNMDQVVTVRVTLLLRGFAPNVVNGTVSFDVDGDTVTASDGRLRKMFTSTVAIRNRLD